MLGKRVLDDLYVHRDVVAACELPVGATAIVEAALASLIGTDLEPNVLKFNLKSGRFSWLAYRDFESAAFPELIASWSFADELGSQSTLRRYDGSLNPPILHRKELLVDPSHPARDVWGALTQAAEAIGLFDDTSVIGFKQNWERLVAAKGFRVDGLQLLPLGNDEGVDSSELDADVDGVVLRHRTALVRTALSAPVQALLRHQLLAPGVSFFDYGCGRGGDVAGLIAEGFEARGWDPHFASDGERVEADVVNLGFVINVIEDPAERAEALHRAFKLTRGVLAVAVMLHGSDVQGVPYADGVLTSRRTFQKYFLQLELKEYIEHALQQTAFMVGPGIAFVFANKELEQRFDTGRYRRRGLVERLLTMARRQIVPRTPRATRPVFEGPPRPSKQQEKQARVRPLLDAIWAQTLDLGRWPEESELVGVDLGDEVSYSTAKRLIAEQYDLAQLNAAARVRSDDILVYVAAQLFGKRRPYRSLEPRLQRDIKAFFGDYGSAQSAAMQLLRDCGDPSKLLEACERAAEQGLGYLEGGQHSLQLHVDLVDRLPSLLRIYVACGLVLWDSISAVQLFKIHIGSGKLTLMEFADEDFLTVPLPRLKRRIKVNLRRLDYDVFEYGSAEYPMPLLYRKSRYLHEESSAYAEQLAFDQALEATGLLGDGDYGPAAAALEQALELKRLGIQGMRLGRSERIPDLDQRCGENFCYRDFTECGETQARLKLRNIPLRPETYNALYDLATQILDPVVEYFGSIRLTYGFCGPELGKHIHSRVAPKLDQHASWEVSRAGKLICERGGAACDFIVADEDMLEVAEWIRRELLFDRLYVYGPSLPLHVSAGPGQSRSAYRMSLSATGRLLPNAISSAR